MQEKGFFILPSELFCNVRVRAAGDENLNETLETVFRHIEGSAQGSESEGSFAGLFDDYDVNSNKLGATVAKRNEKLVKLLNGVADMKLGDVKDHQIDAFGDAYEYLMTMYASNAGKSGGEFFTPADVSELLTRLGTVGKTEVNKVYDPACGSGSLLLKAVKVLGRDAVRNGFYGQEINITTYNLCRINMFLHDIGFDKFDIACEDTLTNPQHWDDEPFELIVSNPPYIPTGDIPGLDPSVRDYEPLIALDGGADGLDFYRFIASRWKNALRLGGTLLFEVGIGQAPEVEEILAQNGFEQIQTTADTQGIWRVVEGIING